MQDEQIYDAFDDATKAEVIEQEYNYYGQLAVEAWSCALVKGQGKVPYDPQQHKQKLTNVDMTLVPLSDMGLSFNLERTGPSGMIVQFKDSGWADVTWASAMECGINHARELNNAWAHVTMAKTGKSYTKQDGTKVEKTTFKILQIFASEDECRAAYLATKGDDIPTTEQSPATTPAPADENKKNALLFIGAIIKNAVAKEGKDLEKVKSHVQSLLDGDYNLMVGQYVSTEDPEVMEKIMVEVSAGENA